MAISSLCHPLVIVIIACCYMHLPTTQSARILTIPNHSSSHVRYFAQVSAPLVERGHKLYAVMNAQCAESIAMLEKIGVVIIPYYLKDKTCDSEDPNNNDHVSDIFKPGDHHDNQIDMIVRFGLKFYEAAEPIFEKKYMDKLRALNVDLCIVDGFVLSLYNFIVPYKLGAPYVALVTTNFESFIGSPGLPSFTPSMMTTFTDKMSFFERIQNTIASIQGYRLVLGLKGSEDELVTKFAPERPVKSMLQLLRGSKLWLLNTDVVLDYPRPTLPHVIHVGGLSTKPGKPLPESFQNVMDNANKGVIILSFGSLVKNLPIEVTQKFVETFRQLKDYDIIMRYVGPKITDVPPNTHLYTWLPQNDLLAHPTVKLFITHCGNNGQFEGLYHGVPMIGLPFYSDQIYNTKRMTVKGFGKGMSITNFTSDELFDNMNDILNNKTFSDAIKKASMIYRSRPDIPTERAAYWIEHVINFGGDYLLSHAVNLPWYQYLLVDVMLLFSAILIVCCVAVMILIKVLCCRQSVKLKSA